ncbi:MAG: potassium transporter TrkA, partial [Epsilonproteobacteria bacterium]|nr:potassium transporter TrkA [Campylobacterota bacterium]
VEYILRLWVHSSISKVIIHQDEYSDLLGKEFDFGFVFKRVLKDKFEYIFSIKAIIDLLAILPFFHELRLLRIFILFRVFKIFRYAKSFSTFSSVLATKKFEFFTLGMFASIVIFVSSVLIYVMEANNPNSPINTLYEAFYWSIVTISTVGYGDVVATSNEGRFVAIVVILAGIAVLAFTTSLFVSAFTERIEDIKESKTVQDISKTKKVYIICGYENIAKEVAKKLLKANFNLIILDSSQQRVEEAKQAGLKALNYNPGSVDSYKKLHVDMSAQVKAILCLREDDVENVYTALTVRSVSSEVPIISLLINSTNRKKLLNSGVNEILYDKEFVGLVAREYMGQPVAFEAIHAITSESSVINIEEVPITDRIRENFASVSDLENVKFRVVLLGIYKKTSDRFLFNPIDSTLLDTGDYLLVIGNYMFIKEFIKHLSIKVKV